MEPPPSLEESPWSPFGLTRLNAGMKRIDLLCKLLAPLAISTLMSRIAPVKVAIGVAIMSSLSWGIEFWCIQNVWAQNCRLREPKECDNDLRRLLTRNGTEETIVNDNPGPTPGETRVPANVRKLWLWLQERLEDVKTSSLNHTEGLKSYFASDVWIPSIAMAILHASVLSYSSTLIVYLLNAGFSLNLITLARGMGSLFEISSTFIFPFGISALSETTTASSGETGHTRVGESQPLLEVDREPEGRDKEKSQAVQNTGVGVMRLGQWSICGLFLNLIPVVLALWHLELSLQASTPPNSGDTKSIYPLKRHPFATLALFSFLSFSLLCRWIYNLTTQQLTQTRVPTPQRASFGGTEMSIVSSVSLVHWISAVVWHAQSDFKWLALGSFIAVGGSAWMYSAWVRGQMRH
ncbi:hypothetical protein FGG08_002937 [Glutinoglossum americanum]|uniref:Solute carrier family 40 member n=1 Tax=Glutinoglossum americanum TaxID=1670608 RepID=A0A9P8I3U6_9PEZI|nr:hypothetical protein FGG08_002937 [Glutinoglossum americanum]